MSVSGLNRPQRHLARDTFVHAMQLVLHHAGEVHYTQDPTARWEGIAHKLDARKGQFPRHGDCSSTTSWALFCALHLRFGLDDIVNGARWLGGYTGTQASHGAELHSQQISHHRTLRGDLVLYGPAPTFEHVAGIVGHRASDGKPLVISHGSEAGPFLLPFDYRPDVGQIRRYI